MERRRSTVAVPELFLGLLSLAVAAVWIAHMFAGTIHDARHTRDTLTITGSARKPIASNLVRWSLSVSGFGRTPAAAARTLQRDVKAVETFLHGGGVPAAGDHGVGRPERDHRHAPLEEEDTYDLPRLASAWM